MPIDPRLTRLDENRVRVNNPYDVETTLFANEQVPVESAAVTELIELLALQDTVRQVAEAAPDSFDATPGSSASPSPPTSTRPAGSRSAR